MQRPHTGAMIRVEIPVRGTDADGRPGQVTAHIGKPADGDGHGHQSAQQGPQRRAVLKIFHQVLGQSHLGHDSQPGRHPLHHNDRDDRENDAPEQLEAIISSGFGGACDRPRSDERPYDQEPRPQRPQLFF